MATDQTVDWGYVWRHNDSGCQWPNANELIDLLTMKNEEWFAGKITRNLAEILVKRPGLPHGSFLVRERLTTTNAKSYALTVNDGNNHYNHGDDRVKHYKIEHDDFDGGYTIMMKPFQIKFDTLTQLVQHYKNHADFLCCKLTYPALRNLPVPATVMLEQERALEGAACHDRTKSTRQENQEAEVKLAVENAVEAVRTPLRETLTCTICQELSHEPTLCVKCGQLVGCYSCVLASVKHDERCPLCRAAWNKSDLTGFIKSRMSFENIPGL